MQEQVCTKCNVAKPLSAYYFNRSVGRVFTRCKVCHNSYAKDWQKTNRVRKLEINEAWRKRNTERVKVMKMAANVVNNAILAGKLVRGTHCSACGSETYVEASHHDYGKPWEFRWLCRSCHRSEDSKNPKSITPDYSPEA